MWSRHVTGSNLGRIHPCLPCASVCVETLNKPLIPKALDPKPRSPKVGRRGRQAARALLPSPWGPFPSPTQRLPGSAPGGFGVFRGLRFQGLL